MLRRSATEFEYLADNVGQFPVPGLLAAQKPGKQILVLTGHQALKPASVRIIQIRIADTDKGFQHQIELQHAAPRGPARCPRT